MSSVLATGTSSFGELSKGFMATARAALPLHASAWDAVMEPVQKLLETSDRDHQEMLSKLWLQHTYSQLNVICVTSALMGGVIATSFTWPLLEQVSQGDQKVILGVWYSALLLALGAIATATQQAVRIARLNTYPDSGQRMRDMLGTLQGTQWRTRKLQLFVWQTPVMLQNGSIYMFIARLVVLIWKAVADDCRSSNSRYVGKGGTTRARR
ncbi:Uu.00g065280.m01.CDS01 [Anthostomella pinea]|uniref:Uu.00g065280.m01.CDS01 n=1 Tax=Anthostomella pinea TaxID=933095 RepID=A0AAI8VUY3_9PEZI|nr:Uu.00g065280.m01.CDS01 [Anthostomella pinea]